MSKDFNNSGSRLDLDDLVDSLTFLDDVSFLEGPELYKYLKESFPGNSHRKRRGFPIRTFSVTPIETVDEFNHLIMLWSVSQFREHELPTVKLQDKRKDKLDGYAKDLFDACFKRW